MCVVQIIRGMILMTKTDAIPAGTLFVAIDVANHCNAVTIEPLVARAKSLVRIMGKLPDPVAQLRCAHTKVPRRLHIGYAAILDQGTPQA